MKNDQEVKTGEDDIEIELYGEPEVVTSRPSNMDEIYGPREVTLEMMKLYLEDQSAYNERVARPLFVEFGAKTTLDGKPASRGTIVLLAPGCANRRSYAEQKAHPNCGFCVFSENYSTGGNPVSSDQFESQAINAMEILEPKFIFGKDDRVDIIEIFNSGSFYNDAEIPAEARDRIITAIQQKSPKNIVLTVEARFADIIGNLDKVEHSLEILNQDGGNRRLEVAFGLETTDPVVSQVLSKGIELTKIENLIHRLAELNVRSFFYVLVKPAPMSEQEAIDIACLSIENIAEISRNLDLPLELKPHISLSPTRTYVNSLLHAYPAYRAPKLWSVTEVIKKFASQYVAEDGSDKVFERVGLHVGMSGESIGIVSDGSPSTQSPECNNGLNKIMADFNRTMDSKAFLSELAKIEDWDRASCGSADRPSCLVEWERQLNDAPVQSIEQENQVIAIRQMKEVMDVERKAWPEEVQAGEDKFQMRAKVFPEGFLLGYRSGRVVGVSTSEIVNFELGEEIKSWEEITNNGYIDPNFDSGLGTGHGHQSAGNSIYVVSLGTHGDYRNKRIGNALILAQRELVKHKNLKYLVLGSRLPGYQAAEKAKPGLKVDEYLEMKNDKGEILDDDIRFYTKAELKISRIVANYMDDDPESLNFGAVMYYENPEYKEQG